MESSDTAKTRHYAGKTTGMETTRETGEALHHPVEIASSVETTDAVEITHEKKLTPKPVVETMQGSKTSYVLETVPTTKTTHVMETEHALETTHAMETAPVTEIVHPKKASLSVESAHADKNATFEGTEQASTDKDIKCLICRELFHSSAKLFDHFNAIHGNPSDCTCSTCSNKNTSHALLGKVNIHKGDEQRTIHICKMCQQAFVTC